MDFLKKRLMLTIFCVLLVPFMIYAQDDSQPEQGPPLADTLAPPPNVDKDKDPKIQIAEYFTFNNQGSDYYYDLAWQVNQPCLFLATVHVWVYREGVQYYYQSFGNIPWLGGAYSTTGWRFYPGPNATVQWKLTTRSDAWACGDNTHSLYVTAKTEPFKIPHTFTVSKDVHPGYVKLNWVCDSEYASHVCVYRDNVLIATVPKSQTEYLDYAALPHTLHEYHVRSYRSGLESGASDRLNGRAVHLSASDGSSVGKVNLKWNDFPSGFEDKLVLERDGVEVIPNVNPGQVSYEDDDAQPGQIHNYTLKVYNNDVLKLTVSDIGFAPANGYISGRVQTSTLGPVKDIAVRAYPTSDILSSAISLDGVDDYVYTPPLKINSNTATLSAWIKRNGTQNDWTAIVFSRANSTVAGIHIMANGELRYNWNNQSPAYSWTSGLFVPDNEWVYVALVIEPDSAILFMNDALAVNKISHGTEEFDGNFEIGRDNASATRYFKGLIDEVVVWKKAHTPEQILLNASHNYRGDEDGLVGYWRFNLGSGTIAGDYAEDGNHHGTITGGATWESDVPDVSHFDITDAEGNFYIRRIYWGEGADFTIKPFKKDHGFKPESAARKLDVDKYIWDEIIFTDTTSVAVSGYVYLDSEVPCPIPGVEIFIDDKTTGVYTDSSGAYAITVGEPGEYTISPGFLNHTFQPMDTTIDIHDAVANLVFMDTTRRTLSGSVTGGCDIFMGKGKIRFKSLISSCIDKTIFTDDAGLYEITLPAQPYTAQVWGIDNPDSITIINYFAPDTIDMTEEDQTYDFIYHAPPQMRLSGFPDKGCGIYNVPIAHQEVTYPITFEVFEQYGIVECPVKSGSIVIDDRVAYGSPDTTIVIENGEAAYLLIPGYPELAKDPVHPHQKRFIVNVHAYRHTVSDTTWLFVRGQKPREFQFSTVSPEIPLMILRDPPGDQSYSYLSRSTTSSVNFGFSYEREVGVGLFAKFKVGGGGDIPGLGSTGAWVGGELEATIGFRNAVEATTEIELKATETLKTSDSDKIIGTAGDVFMGAAINIIYAKTDILEYDPFNCVALRDTGIVWNGDGFRTTYLYTESHIREGVIPGLQSLADILINSPLKVRRDSAEVLLNQVSVWQQVLDYNEELKEQAQPLPLINDLPQFPPNVSFSAGTSLNREATMTSTTTLSVQFNFYIDASVALSIGAKAGDFNEVEAGVKVLAKLDIGTTVGGSFSISNTVGFELGDDDTDGPGDVFTVDILGDPVYCTPVFDLLSGTSSCPWEHPTLPREGVGLSMDTYVKHDVEADQPAQFELYLTNSSQSEETREYLLSAVQASNPDAAILQIAGAVMGDDEIPYEMPPNLDNPLKQTLRVTRDAGSAYDYEDLQVHLYSECDDQFDTTVTFDVYYVKPCSDVSIAQPQNYWILNNTHNDKLITVLKDYDASDPDMTELKLEYRKAGTIDWIKVYSYARAQLPADSLLYEWDVSGLVEGTYELRASTLCPAGTFYSHRATGHIDRTAPFAFGKPEPADGMLDAGDEISVQLSENIDCASANKNNISMVHVSDGSAIDINIICKGDELIIEPKDDSDLVEGETILVTISSLLDPYGNDIAEPITWEFTVNIISALPELDTEPAIPTEFALKQNYPNPFNPVTTIRYAILHSEYVTLVIYNIKGQEILRLVDEHLAPGFYNITMDGRHLSSGVYFYRLKAGRFVDTKKLILLK